MPANAVAAATAMAYAVAMARSAFAEIDPLDVTNESLVESNIDPEDNMANRSRNNVRSTPSLDEEVIRKRGRKQKQTTARPSLDPMILATMKSPVKRINRSSTDILKIS